MRARHGSGLGMEEEDGAKERGDHLVAVVAAVRCEGPWWRRSVATSVVSAQVCLAQVRIWSG
jgi:hypothetical protein